nr:hypothetical protein [Tanacetum cinerariifolium]
CSFTDVARYHDGDGEGEDRPLYTMYPTAAWVALLTEEHCPSRLKSAKPGKEHGHISTGIARLRDEMSSTTQEYPSLIDTFFVAHIVNGEFLWDEDRHIYEEMRRLEAMGTYTDDEINRLARGGKQPGNIPSVGRVLPAWATASPSTPAHDKKVDFIMSLFKTASKYSDMFLQFEREWRGRRGGSFPGDMSPGNMCCRGTYFLIGKNVGPIVLLGIVLREGIPYEHRRQNDVFAETTATISTCKFL